MSKKRFWIEMDGESEYSNPTGNVCWGTYPGDEPSIGIWIKVEEIDKDV